MSFAFSLHAPNQTLRAELVPFAEKFPLDELMKECDEYARMTGNKVFYEYVLIKNINDTNECAHEM
ncbi:hypothetical protein GW750_06045 [bacterium]|nr:hypothetical protein [bacterium]